MIDEIGGDTELLKNACRRVTQHISQSYKKNRNITYVIFNAGWILNPACVNPINSSKFFVKISAKLCGRLSRVTQCPIRKL